MSRGRKLKTLDRPRESIRSALPGERPRFHEGPHALLEEKRVALRPLDQQALEVGESRTRPQERLQQLSRACRRQRVEPHLLVVRLAAPAVAVFRPVVRQQEQPRCRQALDQQVEPRLRVPIDPMQILDHQQHRCTGSPHQQPLQRLQVCRLRCADRASPTRGLDPTSSSDRNTGTPLQRAIQRQELARHLLTHLPAIVAGLNPEVAAQELDDGEVRRGLAVGHGGGFEHQPPAAAVRVGKLPDQSRLAHAWLAHDRDELAVALARSPQRLPQQLDLRVTADEAREPARGSGVQPAPHRARARQLEDLDWCCHPLHRHRTARGYLHETLGEGQRLGSQQGGPGLGHLLHARGQVRALTHRRVVHVEIRPDRPNHHVTRVQTHADLDGHPETAKHALGVPLHRLLHPQRGVTGPHGVILVGQRRAEQRHDPVAHDLVDGALVAVDRLHHVLEHGVEELARFLWIAIGQQLHRPLQIGEEDGDLLALAFQSRLGGEDFLGEVLGSVGLRRRESPR